MITQRYGKLIDGGIEYATIPIMVDGVETWTNDPAVYASIGYLPIAYTDKPKTEGYWYEVSYVERNGVIVREWIAHEIPVTDEISDAEALAIITGGAAV